MTKPQLVDDLIPLILESQDDWWTKRELTRLALISPLWRHYVRKRLYTLPSLHTLKACELLARTLCESPTLAELVEGIELRPEYDEEGRATAKQLQAVQILLGLEGLQKLTLGGSLSIRAERFLQNAVAFPESISTLEVIGDDSCGLLRDGSLELDQDFWYRFCSVETLKLVNLRVDVVRPDLAAPAPIKRATITNCDIALAELLASCSLDLLSIHADCSCQYYQDLQEILQNADVGQPKALHYSLNKGCRDSDGSFLAQPQGTSTSQSTLRSLRLDGHFIELDLLNNLTLYPSLEELVVSGRSVRISSEEWAQFISSGGLPSLKRLQLPGGTSQPPYAKWAAKEVDDLHRQCSSRQIHLLE